MDYSLITERELFKRFNSLPESIQNVLEREANHQIIERVCKNHHLIDEEKALMIKQLTGLVIFGFIHTEDLGLEINEALELNNPRLAASIADEISRKIFSSIQDDLERNFEPLPEPEIESGPAPKILSEIKKPVETFGPRPEPPIPTGQAVPSPTSPPREPAETFEEKPIILHEETEFEPGKPSAGFKLEAPPPTFSEEKFTPAMRPARLEIGDEEAPAEPRAPSRPPTETQKVVNYTYLQTPPTPRIEQGFGGQAPATKPLMSPEQELPAPTARRGEPAPQITILSSPTFKPLYSPPQPAKEINIRAEEIKIIMPMQKKRRGFWGWLKSLFSRKPQKEIIFAPKVISEEELKREALTIKASMPKPPSPPPRPTQPPQPQPSESLRPSAPTQPTQRPARGPSVFEEVVDLSTLTKTKKSFPPRETPETGNGNTINLKH